MTVFCLLFYSELDLREHINQIVEKIKFTTESSMILKYFIFKGCIKLEGPTSNKEAIL